MQLFMRIYIFPHQLLIAPDKNHKRKFAQDPANIKSEFATTRGGNSRTKQYIKRTKIPPKRENRFEFFIPTFVRLNTSYPRCETQMRFNGEQSPFLLASGSGRDYWKWGLEDLCRSKNGETRLKIFFEVIHINNACRIQFRRNEIVPPCMFGFFFSIVGRGCVMKNCILSINLFIG